jgi:hypothetical protein
MSTSSPKDKEFSLDSAKTSPTHSSNEKTLESATGKGNKAKHSKEEVPSSKLSVHTEPDNEKGNGEESNDKDSSNEKDKSSNKSSKEISSGDKERVEGSPNKESIHFSPSERMDPKDSPLSAASTDHDKEPTFHDEPSSTATAH